MEIVSGEFKLVRLDRHVRLGDKSMILNILLFSLIKRACAVIVMTIMFDVIIFSPSVRGRRGRKIGTLVNVGV